MDELRTCTKCRFFNRWAIAPITFADEEPAQICRKQAWVYVPGELSEHELADRLSISETCIHYETKGNK